MGTFLDRLMPVWPELNTGAFVVISLVAVALITFVVGVALRRRPAPSPSPAELVPSDRRKEEQGLLSASNGEDGRADAERSKALLAFSQELLGATTTGQVRTILACHFPPMVGSRRLWISTQIRGRRKVIVGDSPDGTRDLLNTRGQEWTTFPLRIDRQVIGLLGIESAGGLKPHVKRFIQLATPFIAQALNTADQFETLREASLVDLLTGTATRREGLTRLGAEIKRAQRTGSAMAVLMLDLDRFKSINDRFGHAVGDAVLTEVGRTLQRTLRASDSRCRWGGEEFLIVLPDTDLTRAQVVANNLLRNVAAATVPTPVGPVGSTVSIGLTITRPGETQIEQIVRRADIALYRAKEAGRGCVRVVLGDRDGNPIGFRSDDEPKPPPKPSRSGPLPFPDRRNPLRRDRRNVPSPGRRSTDPRPQSREQREVSAGEKREPLAGEKRDLFAGEELEVLATAGDSRARSNLR